MLHIKKEISIIFTFFVGYLFLDLFCIDYNFATLLLVLLLIFNEIKFYKNRFQHALLSTVEIQVRVEQSRFELLHI